jgi:RNA 2',3'-cyclic 3'-phosphodiesterase
MRAFIAIELPPGIQEALGRVQNLLREQLRYHPTCDSQLRWSKPEGIHLTLKFLGEISQLQANQAVDLLRRFGPFEKFTIEIKGCGFFPDRRRPRVLWAGIAAPPALADLALRIEKSMASIGFPVETRSFVPHLTLARFKAPRPQTTLETALTQLSHQAIGQFEVSEFLLFESQLSAGSLVQYRKVARFPEP